MEEKACIYCGKTFVPAKTGGKLQVTCGSAECKYKRQHRKRHKLVCTICGTTYDCRKKDQKYCSAECTAEGVSRTYLEIARQRRLPILHTNPSPACVLHPKHPVRTWRPQKKRLWIGCTCVICGANFLTPDVRHATCGPICSARKLHAERHNRRAYERALTRGQQVGVFSAGEWGRRLLEFGGRCAYCHGNGSIEIEHVVPLCRGGTNRIANVVPACKDCNQDKGMMTPAEWAVASPLAMTTLRHDWPTGESEGLLVPLRVDLLPRQQRELLLSPR